MQNLRAPAAFLDGLEPYDPKYLPARIYLNANESPYGLPEQVLAELKGSLSKQMLQRYPDPLAKALRARLAEINSVGETNVLLGNGGDELLFNIFLAYGGRGRKLLIAPPSFFSYEQDARLTDTEIVEIPRMRVSASDNRRPGSKNLSPGDALLSVDEDALLKRVSQADIDIVMLTSPNNPTGDTLREDFVLDLLDASDALVLIDQAYVEFADSRYDMRSHLLEHKNLAILRTFSKAYALAGVRLGYLLASDEILSELCKVRQPYSVDAFSALAGQVVLTDPEQFHVRVKEIVKGRERVLQALREMPGLTVYPSEANFILIQVHDAHRIWQRLYDEKGILLRDFSSAPHLANCLRVSIGTPEENEEFLESLKEISGGLL